MKRGLKQLIIVGVLLLFAVPPTFAQRNHRITLGKVIKKTRMNILFRRMDNRRLITAPRKRTRFRYTHCWLRIQSHPTGDRATIINCLVYHD